MDGAHQDRFESASFYKRAEHQNKPYQEYRDAQTIRHKAKSAKRREKEYYEALAKEFAPYKTDASKMLCMGTRNNHERNCFREFLNLEEIYSIDIAPRSKADYILDFSALPREWKGEWDFIFSNALDHALDATACINEWIRVLKPKGILLLRIDAGSQDPNKLCASDCNAFNEVQVSRFLNKRQSLVKVIDGSSKGPFCGGHVSSEYFPNWPDLLIQKI